MYRYIYIYIRQNCDIITACIDKDSYHFQK